MDKKFVILMRLVRLGTINLHTINLHMYTQLAQTMCRAFWVTEALLLTPPTNLTEARGCPRKYIRLWTSKLYRKARYNAVFDVGGTMANTCPMRTGASRHDAHLEIPSGISPGPLVARSSSNPPTTNTRSLTQAQCW